MSTTPAALKTTSPTNTATRTPAVRNLLMWMLSFLAIPIAGFLGTAIVGRVDNLVSALVGGAVVGLIVGAVQALVSRRRLPLLRWMTASTIGTSVGLGAGTLAVGYQTSLGSLALAGLITGVIVGLAQTFALPASTRFRWLWLPVTAALWPLGWTVTTLAGIKVEEQIIVFGASGAFVYTLLAGLMLQVLLPQLVAKASAPSRSARDESDRARHLRLRRDRPGHLRRPPHPRHDPADHQPIRHRAGPRQHRAPAYDGTAR